MIPKRYFVALDSGQDWSEVVWTEVTKKTFVLAERNAGFRNPLGDPDEPATAGFGGRGIQGYVSLGGHLPQTFIPLSKEAPMTSANPNQEIPTPEEFHASLRRDFELHLENVTRGKEEEFSFLREEGVNYNEWIEHRHGWPVTQDLLCGVRSLACCEECGRPEPCYYEDCETCVILVWMYREHCERAREYNAKASREKARRKE